MIKTRFCPSPTGNVHLGNVRTALFNALLARRDDGVFLLRIEDTDKLRSDDKYTRQLMEDLHWMGLDWQEGPEVGGSAGPYWQSERQTIYDEYYEQLINKSVAYPCFCTEQHLMITRKIQMSSGIAPRYDGSCRNLTVEQVKEKYAQGLKPTLRFRIPEHQFVEFPDEVKGLQRFATDDLGDFIIRRADGTPPFMYCNAIDDAMMGVTHVLRGEDHLTNTPRQILILQSLGLRIPTYAHMSLITSLDGGPLSKRLGSLSIKDMRTEGYFPLAIINYLARLGHYFIDNHFMSLRELSAGFQLSALSGAPAKFDPTQLLHWQKLAVMQTTDDALWHWLGLEVVHLVPEALKNEFIHAVRPNCLFPVDGRHWAQRFFAAELMFNEEDMTVLRNTPATFFSEVLTALEQHGADVKQIYQYLTQALAIKGPAIYKPLRVALTGQLDGPELAQIFHLMGIAQVKARIESVLRLL